MNCIVKLVLAWVTQLPSLVVNMSYTAVLCQVSGRLPNRQLIIIISHYNHNLCINTEYDIVYNPLKIIQISL